MLIDYILFYAPSNNVSVISLQQLALFMSFLDFTCTRLGLSKNTFRKTQRIQCGLNLRSLDYRSNTWPLSHARPRNQCRKRTKCWLLCFLQNFWKPFPSGSLQPRIAWWRVRPLPKCLKFKQISEEKAFEDIVRKKRKCWHLAFFSPSTFFFYIPF